MPSLERLMELEQLKELGWPKELGRKVKGLFTLTNRRRGEMIAGKKASIYSLLNLRIGQETMGRSTPERGVQPRNKKDFLDSKKLSNRTACLSEL